MKPRFLSLLILLLGSTGFAERTHDITVDDYFFLFYFMRSPCLQAPYAADFFATRLGALGVEHDKEYMTGARPVPLSDFGTKTIKEVLA